MPFRPTTLETLKFRLGEDPPALAHKLNGLVGHVRDRGGGSSSSIVDGDKGDVSVSGSGAAWSINSGAVGSTEIADGAVVNAKLAEVVTSTIKGRASAGSGDVEDLTPAQVRTMLNVADGATANTGTVTSVSGTGSVNGLTLTGAVTSSGNLTLGGALSVAIADVTNLQSSLDAKVPTSRTISAGTGLTGGGSLAANRTISANVATQAEAEAGTSSTKLMTPQRTAQAIAALAGGGGSGDWVQIGATVNTTSGSSWSFTSIPQTYQGLMLVYEGLGSTSSFTVNMEVSVDNGSSYGGQCVHSALSSTAAYGFFHILGYRSTPFAAVVYGQFRSASAPTSPTAANSSTANNRSGVFTGVSAINAVRLNISTGTANAGTLRLFGR